MKKEINTPAGTLHSMNGMIVSYTRNDVEYRIGGLVYVTGDVHGHVCPGIDEEGLGEIVSFQEHDTDHFIGVKMLDSGQIGFMKSARITNLTRLDKSRQKKTAFSNWRLVVNAYDLPIALLVDGIERVRLGDRVMVCPDKKGWISCQIHEGGLGRITRMRSDDIDHFFGVTMYDGSFDYLKLERITKI